VNLRATWPILGWLVLVGAIVAAGLLGSAAHAQDVETTPTQPSAARPAILFNRWQEDWSVLADPNTPRQPFDALKYIPLSPDDPKTYLSFGGDVRERFEANDAPSFGVGPRGRNTDYDISRLELHADLRVDQQLQAFVQLQSDYAPGKTQLSPVDQDRLGLEQAFVVLTEPLAGGEFKLRVGRQQFAFDLQRFVSARDGPNVRQSYDAIWSDYEHGPWRLNAFYSQPVQNRDAHAFDDYSSGRLTYGGVRVERKLFGFLRVSTYLSRFTQDNVTFPSAHGNERRDIADVRVVGAVDGFDWDLEAMGQGGRIGGEQIGAWAMGSLAGYTLGHVDWTPRLGLQVDAASGDADPHDHRLGTFNPLFPNGYYVNLAGYTAYVNFIHVKPSVTIHPIEPLKVMFAAAAQWRETTADAVYTQPDIPVAGTAGRPGQYTGTYGQLRIDWALTKQVALALEAVHFAVSDVIRQVGGHDGDYLGAEVRLGW
jgi:hypothetical protein